MKLIWLGLVTASLVFADAKERGRELTQQFYKGELGPLFEQMGPDLRKLIGTTEKFSAMREQARGLLGAETELATEDVGSQSGSTSYRRVAKLEKGWTAEIIWAWDDKLILGFGIRPAQKEFASRFLDYHTKASMRLPFDGEWLVAWGGRTLKKNHHAVAPDQRFAYDLVIEKDGKTHAEGNPNENHFCWNQPIYAPAAGKVVFVKDGVEDNAPGKMNPSEAAGNYVVLEIGAEEYALMAHFRNGSVAVKTDDAVKQGELLGRCGNSGNSSEPHLHFHLQTKPKFGEGEGLPAEFVGFLAGRKVVARGELRRRQLVRNGE